MGGRGSNRTPARWLAVAVVVLLVAGTTLLAERRPASAPVGWRGVALARAAPGVPKEPAPRVADTPSPTPTPDRSATPTPTPTATPTPEPPATPPVVMPTSPVVTPTPTIEPVEVSSPRSAVTTGFVPFATVAGIDVHHPTDVVERVGFHQSNHEGARDLQVYDTAAAPLVLPSRDRLSGLQSAADVVVDPAGEVRAPVSGVVVRAGSYNLYCDLYDDFVVIAPDVRPEWEVKILHIVDVGVTAGDRVEGGITPIAATARLLPFASQVDEWTAEPSWPHTHIEVVDPSIENVPNGGSGYEDC